MNASPAAAQRDPFYAEHSARAAFWGTLVDHNRPRQLHEAGLPNGYRVRVDDNVQLLDRAQQRLETGDSYDKAEALQMLSAARATPDAQAAADMLLRFTRSPELDVRAACYRSLGWLGFKSPEVVQALTASAGDIAGKDELHARGTFHDALEALVELEANTPEARALYAKASLPFTLDQIAARVPNSLPLVESTIKTGLTSTSVNDMRGALERAKMLGADALPLLRNLVSFRPTLGDDIFAMGAFGKLRELRDEAVECMHPSTIRLAYERTRAWFQETKRQGFIGSLLNQAFDALAG